MFVAVAATLVLSLSFWLLSHWADSPSLGWSWLGLWFILTGAAVACLGSIGHLWG